jgi:hypothetical protein
MRSFCIACAGWGDLFLQEENIKSEVYFRNEFFSFYLHIRFIKQFTQKNIFTAVHIMKKKIK